MTWDRYVPSLASSSGVLATMHQKERVIGPVLAETCGLSLVVPDGLDTDRFGTFTLEVARVGDALDAARAKAHAAWERQPHARIAVASEGSFGPHPAIPFLALGDERVLWLDRETGLEMVGRDVSTDTNFAHAQVDALPAAMRFAERIGFPAHAVHVLAWHDGAPAPARFARKGIADERTLAEAIQEVVGADGQAFIETDMRAHLNPTRMRAIERATRDLVRRLASACPACARPGFDVIARTGGRPSGGCGQPTRIATTQVLRCEACGCTAEFPISGPAAVDPGQCDWCNP
jgi:hypothetical protein